METNKLYECTVIIDGGLQDEPIAEAMAMVQKVITEKGGSIKSVLDIGRRKTAYPINKKTIATMPTLNLPQTLRLLPRLRGYSVMRMSFCAI